MTHKMASVTRGFLPHSAGQILFELAVASVTTSISLYSCLFVFIPFVQAQAVYLASETFSFKKPKLNENNNNNSNKQL